MVTSFCSPFLSDVSHVSFMQSPMDAESSAAVVLSALPCLSGQVSVVPCLVIAVWWQTRL